MSAIFEELDWRPTSIGVLSLRRRRLPESDTDVYEIKLDDDFLMSSQFTLAEVELARQGLAASAAPALDVLVGGLGLGYTADAALDEPRLRSLSVIELLAPVLDWHRDHLLPLGERLATDPRCKLLEGDFFAMIDAPPDDLDPRVGPGPFHAILVDIDHSPRRMLAEGNAAFYSAARLGRLAAHLHPGGVFALWSDDPPDAMLLEDLNAAFATASAQIVGFASASDGDTATNTIYIATT